MTDQTRLFIPQDGDVHNSSNIAGVVALKEGLGFSDILGREGLHRLNAVFEEALKNHSTW